MFQGPSEGKAISKVPSTLVVTPNRMSSDTKTAAPGNGVPLVSTTLPVNTNSPSEVCTIADKGEMAAIKTTAARSVMVRGLGVIVFSGRRI